VSTDPFSTRLSRAWGTLVGTYKNPVVDPKVAEKPMFGERALSDPFRLVGGGPSFTPYNPSKLISLKGYEVFDEMRRDDQVKAAMSFKKQAVLSAGWDVSPPEGSEHDDEKTKFVIENLERLEGTFENALLGIMSALDYGFSISEKVWEEKDGKIHMIALKTKRPHPFHFKIDKFGNVKGLQQDGNDKDLPIEKFLVYQYQSEFGNPYGISDLDAAYRAWWTKNNTYKWLAMLLEKYGIPPLIAMYDPAAYKAGQIDYMKQILEGLQASTVATVPRSNKDELEFFSPELAGQVSQCFIPALSMMNTDIARAILVPGDLGYTPGGEGSFAKAKVIFDVFLFAVEALRRDLANAINENLVQPLIEINYGTTEGYPKFRFLPLTDEQQLARLESWMQMIGAGAVKGQSEDEDHIREALDFPERLIKLDDSEYLPPEPDPFGGAPGGSGAPGGGKGPAKPRPSQKGRLPSQSVADNPKKGTKRAISTRITVR
jgi:phage gp29-like protein